MRLEYAAGDTRPESLSAALSHAIARGIAHPNSAAPRLSLTDAESALARSLAAMLRIPVAALVSRAGMLAVKQCLEVEGALLEAAAEAAYRSRPPRVVAIPMRRGLSTGARYAGAAAAAVGLEHVSLTVRPSKSRGDDGGREDAISNPVTPSVLHPITCLA